MSRESYRRNNPFVSDDYQKLSYLTFTGFPSMGLIQVDNGDYSFMDGRECFSCEKILSVGDIVLPILTAEIIAICKPCLMTMLMMSPVSEEEFSLSVENLTRIVDES